MICWVEHEKKFYKRGSWLRISFFYVYVVTKGSMFESGIIDGI